MAPNQQLRAAPELKNMPAEPRAFDAKLASLQPKQALGWQARLELFLLEAIRYLTCCCCYHCRKPFAFTKPNKAQDWSANRTVSPCPAQLKVSTVDKRTIEVKVTYAENAARSTQLYEVDVFMFFLKDLEAVTTNFYHDLWQSTRLHTPKVPLASMASGETPDCLSDLIKEQLLVIQYKQLVGNEQDASVQKDIDKAVDTLVQQLRLQACMFRQSVRRAMKGVTTKLEQVQGSSADKGALQKLSASIGGVVQQLAEVVNKLHQLCHPCESEEVPETVKETWKMVDEYMLTEAEIALVKLLETMDKAAPLHAQPCTESDNVMRHAAKQSSGHALAQSISVSAPHASTAEEAEAMSHSSRSSSSSSEPECTQQQLSGSIVADSNQITFSTDITRTESVPDAKDADVAAGVHCKPSNVMLSDSVVDRGMAESGTQPTLPALSSQAAVELRGQASEAAHGQVHDPSRQASLHPEGVSVHSAGRPVFRHSSASSLFRNASGAEVMLPTSHDFTSDDSSPSLKALLTASAGCKAGYASSGPKAPGSFDCDSALDGSPAAHLTEQNDSDRCAHWDSFEEKIAGPRGQQAAAYSLLCNPRRASVQKRSNGQRSSSNMDCVPEIQEDEEEQELCQSNMQSLILKAKALQAARSGDHCRHSLDSSDVCQQGNAASMSKVQALAGARQLIVDAVEHLQEEMRQRTYYESMIHDDDTYHNEVYTNRIKCLKHNARAAVVLKHQTMQQSFLLADVVGATIAGCAMCLAIGGIYLAYRFSRYQLNPLYVLITVVAYMMKDRVKEWGKRYLQPVCLKFGFEFPDRIVKVRDARGRRVGRCKEWAKVVGDDQVDARVLAMRHKDLPYVPKLQKATKPERVMTYRKKMEVNWDRLDPRLQCVDGLDDIMRFDLQHFCRRMQPSEEPHYRMCTGPSGRKYAEQVQCARVYHINVVLRIRTSTQDRVSDRAYKEKSMQIQRARVIMDQDGIKRLEATDDSVHLKSDRRALHRLTTPEWLADVHMPSMQLPRMQMPYMRFPAFGRRLPESKSSSSLPQEEAV